MDKIVTNLWAETQLIIWSERYWLVSVAPSSLKDALALIAASGSRFAAIIMERDEVSLTVCDEVWREWKVRLPGHKEAGPYQVITFALNIDLGVCGYLLPAAERLAKAGISIMPQCAYLKDHLVIRESDTALAVQILNNLIADCQTLSDKAKNTP